MDGSQITDEDLALQCREGDDGAWATLVRRHSRLVFSLAYRSVRRADEAEDLVQDVFWKVSRTLDKYDRGSAFKPWLLQVTRNHLIDHHRSRRRERASTVELDALPVEPGSTGPTQQSDLLRRERERIVRSGMAELPEALREAVVLRDVEGLEYEDIAAALGVPLGTVKSRINRGRLHLARALAGLREELA